MARLSALVAALSLIIALSGAGGMQLHRPWSEKHWCALVRDPHWPWAYWKDEEVSWKGRTASNVANLGHNCTTRGTQSKCSWCEKIRCGNDKSKWCDMQVQGMDPTKAERNVMTVSDTPWAVGGSHRNDFKGASTTHVCLMLSPGTCLDTSAAAFDFRSCKVRCWGYSNSVQNYKPSPKSFPPQEPDPILNRLETVGWEWDESLLPKRSQGKVITLAGSTAGKSGHLDGPAASALFDRPTSVAIDRLGNIFIADSGNHCIRRLDRASMTVTTIAGSPKVSGFKDGLASTALFDNPSSITLYYDWGVKYDSRTGTPISNGIGELVLIISDTNNHRLRKIVYSASGLPLIVETLAGKKTLPPGAGFSDGDATEARFNFPLGVAVDDQGIVFVADSHNHLIRRVHPNGDVFTLAGSIEQPQDFDPNNPVDVESCPPPCFQGIPGDEDGPLNQAKFFFPRDVAIGLESTVLVTDSNRVRRVTRNGTVSVIQGVTYENSVTTIAGIFGNEFAGKRDGNSKEATFNGPNSLTMDTATGTIYVADTSSCRIRRITAAKQVAEVAQCSTTLQDVVRPIGCTSFEPPLDALQLQATDITGNIHYRYVERGESGELEGWIAAEYSYLGRRLYRCQGVTPWKTKTASTGETRGPRDGTKSAVFTVDEDIEHGSAIYLNCPANCGSQSAAPVFGGAEYTDDSSICRAAVHSGVLEDSQGGTVRVIITKGTTSAFSASSQNGVDTQERQNGWQRSFLLEAYPETEIQVTTVAGSPAAPLEDPCGTPGSEAYSLPLAAKFNLPSGISIPANTTLSESNLLYIADTNNHAVRAMTATCGKVCENGGECIGDEVCECASGWTGSDCTTPVCTTCSGARQICVAPETCDCVPGYSGFPTCETPLCVQNCQHGGVCSSPDTCTCQSGWMDANCTTPICSQTCGNGANCTAPDTCTCPSDWTGSDCRTPVCRQTCSNGGACIAPDTCSCPPQWSGHDCSLPVCNQGFLVSDPSKYVGSLARQTIRKADSTRRPLASRGSALPSEIEGISWRQYEPCDDSFPKSWCTATGEFDCSQEARVKTEQQVLRGAQWRDVTGFSPFDGSLMNGSLCVRMELTISARTPFPYEKETGPSDLTPLWRYTPQTPYGWNAAYAPGPDTEELRLAGVDGWRSSAASDSDRIIAHVRWVDLKQGVYVCANGGDCTAPDTCVCAPGWAGFDCRTPICEQGYFEPPSAQNPGYVEFEDGILEPQRYPNQGLYECSIRSVTQWENKEYLFDHPNYYSRYMDHHNTEWGPTTRYQLHPETPYYWDDMGWPATYLHTDPDGNHTNRGWTRDGYWERIPGTSWKKGKCTVEFSRYCPNDKTKGVDVRTLQHMNPVADTDSAFRAIIYHTDEKTRAVGRWRTKGGECVDHVHRGCKNNGTCVGPNTCECAPGWTGADCTIPLCEQTCSRATVEGEDLGYDNNGLKVFQRGMGWCTLPNTCTCEKGWSGHDCSIALCAQECNNNGRCSAPDTCTCARWKSSWWDEQRDGGQPLFQDVAGEPQLTGWTGYDCSTPICVQAERFILNDYVGSARLGGYGLILYGDEPWNNLLRPDLISPPYYPYTLSNDIPPVKQWLPGLREHNLALWALDEAFLEETYRLCRMQKLRFCLAFPNASPLRPTWSPGDGEVVRNDGRSYQSGCKSWSNRFSDSLEGVSQGYLCNVLLWEQGDYDFGRYIRVNDDSTSYEKISNLTEAELLDINLHHWQKRTSTAGEGVYSCYNSGSCVSPDYCSCTDGYTGDDCSDPLCRHEQYDGTIVSCLNGGFCEFRDKCKCVQTDSLLHLTYPKVPTGKTGFNGSDCSIPMCMQGTFDPTCFGVAPGGEGCFRCKNGGNCTAPDYCTCPPEWTGYDCGTPVCELRVDEQIIADLQTSDLEKLQAFELDPCQNSKTFSWNGAKTGQGNCTAPNTCTCTCMERAWLDENGEWTQLPWHHPLGKQPPIGYIEGTLQCVDGYEGIKDSTSGLFRSCHLRIYLPKWYERYAVTLIVLSVLFALFSILLYLYIRRRIRQKYLLSRAARRMTMADKDVVPLKKRRATALKKKRRTARKVA